MKTRFGMAIETFEAFCKEYQWADTELMVICEHALRIVGENRQNRKESLTMLVDLIRAMRKEVEKE